MESIKFKYKGRNHAVKRCFDFVNDERKEGEKSYAKILDWKDGENYGVSRAEIRLMGLENPEIRNRN